MAKNQGEPRRGLSSTAKIAIGLFLGVLCGLFFGELVAWMNGLGKVYLGLLQMTVLPYVTLALMSKVPRLRASGGSGFVLRATVVLLVLWTVGGLAIVLTTQALPPWEAARFFSSFAAESQSFDFMELYVPVNPFSSLAKGIVPAIVVFALSVGIALAVIPEHDTLLRQMDMLNDALGTITSYLTRWMPVGVFVMTAAAAGTMTIDELARLQGYLAMYVLAVVLLVWVVLPGMIAAVTPFSRREVLAASKEALITAFATGKLFVVLPLLIDGIQEAFERRGLDGEGAKARASVLVPLGYAFPHLGKLMVLLFLPFSAWYVGEPLNAMGFATLFGQGLASSFGSPLMSVPFLLDVLELPDDLFQLFVVSGVLTMRLGDMLGAASLIALSILTITWTSGKLTLRVPRLLVSGAWIVGLSAIAILATHRALDWSLGDGQKLDQAVRAMKLEEKPQPHVVLAESSPNPEPLRAGETLLQRIERRGVLRVGYGPTALPFAFTNADGDLVGFDIAMAHRLARDLDLALEFVPVKRSEELAALRGDHCDLVMSGVMGRPDLFREVLVTQPYLDANIAFLVRDHVDAEDLPELDPLRVFTAIHERTSERIRRFFPQAEVIEIADTTDFFDEEREENEVLLCTAEEGGAYTIFRPRYKVISPLTRPLRIPLVYPVGGHGESLRSFLDAWIDLQHRQGKLDTLRDHWVLGQGAQGTLPRWSVLRDVLEVGD